MKVQGTTSTGVTIVAPLTTEEIATAAEAAKAAEAKAAEAAGRAADADVIRTLRNTESSFEALSTAVSLARSANAYLFVTNEATGKPFTSHTAYITSRSASFPLVSKAMGKALVVDMHAHGDSIRAAAAAAGVSVGTAAAHVKAAKADALAKAEAAEAAKAETVIAEAEASGDTEAAEATKAEVAAKAEAKAKRESAAEAKAEAKATAKAVQLATDALTRVENMIGDFNPDQLATLLLAIENAGLTVRATAEAKAATVGTGNPVVTEDRVAEAKARKEEASKPAESLAENLGLAKPAPSVKPGDTRKRATA